MSPTTVLYRWDVLSKRRHLVTIAGADAHAQIAWRASDPIAGGCLGADSELRVVFPNHVGSRASRAGAHRRRGGRRGDDHARDSGRTSLHGG